MDPTAPFSFDAVAAPATGPAIAQFALAGGHPGYEAAEDNGRRRPVVARSLSEDRVLKRNQRHRLAATTRDVARNFAVACWAVNKHLDYVSRFRFRGTGPNEAFNRQLEKLVEDLGRPGRFDLAGRHSLRSAIRLLESHAVLDGDGYWAKYGAGRSRGRVELVEGDRVRDEGAADRQDTKETQWLNGVEVERATGRAIRVAIANRTDSGFEAGRVVPSKFLIHRAYFARYDQVRGVSPIAAAITTLKDVDESFDFARAKLKLGQMLGLVTKRSAEGPLADYVASQEIAKRSEEDQHGDTQYEVDLSGGMFALDMERGDDVELLESKTPATEVVNFLKLQIHVALRALDIPYSFFDESFTNFYGQRGSFLSYLQSAQVKREANIEALDAWTRWRLALAVADGELELPEGWTFDQIEWLWLPVGQPWWDPAKEITASLLEIGAGLNSPQEVCHSLGRDFERNVDATAAAMKYAADKGVTLSFAASSVEKGDLTNPEEGGAAALMDPSDPEGVEDNAADGGDGLTNPEATP
jgi:capsid protein